MRGFISFIGQGEPRSATSTKEQVFLRFKKPSFDPNYSTTPIMMSYSQMIDSPSISAKRSQLKPEQNHLSLIGVEKRLPCPVGECDAGSICRLCVNRSYPASPQLQRHRPTEPCSWGDVVVVVEDDDIDDDVEMSMSASCLPPCAKKQRRGPRDDDESMVTNSHTYCRSDSSFSVSSFASQQQSGHRKSRNRAFTGQDFQRLIISQF